MTGMYNVLEKLRAAEAQSSHHAPRDEPRSPASVKKASSHINHAHTYGLFTTERDGYILTAEEEQTARGKGTKKKPAKAKVKEKSKAPAKAAWPKKVPEQVATVRQSLQDHKGPTTSEAIATRFKSVNAETVEELLDTLVLNGQARLLPDGRYVA